VQLLLIESGLDSLGWLAERLAGSGFVVRQVHSLEQALQDGVAERATAVIADIGHSGPQGQAIATLLRKAGMTQPLMILSARGDWRERVETLDAGADDYVAKPVRSEEVAARLRALIRRSIGSPTDQITVGDIELDLKARCAWLAGKCLNLTRNEFRLLRLFLLQPERIMTHQEIRDRLHSGEADCSRNAIEVQIARLRRKVGRHRIRTIRGVGYRYIADSVPGVASTCEKELCRGTAGGQHWGRACPGREPARIENLKAG